MVIVSLEDCERERGVAVNAAVELGDEDLEWGPEEVRGEEDAVEFWGSSAGGAATATFTSASNADVELVAVEILVLEDCDNEGWEVEELLVVEVVVVVVVDGWKAIMDFSDDDVLLLLPDGSHFCLE